MVTTTTSFSGKTYQFVQRGEQTFRVTWAMWKGNLIKLETPADESCCDEHQLQVMHHGQNDGTHMCPTGLIYCPHCMAITDEPEPYECEVYIIGPETQARMDAHPERETE